MLTPTPHEAAHSHLDTAAAAPRQREFTGDTPLLLIWEHRDAGGTAACTLEAPRSKQSVSFTLTLSNPRFTFDFEGDARGAIWLVFSETKARLEGDFSTGPNTGFEGLIDSWPARLPVMGTPSVGRALENPANSSKLFSFLWTRPPQSTPPGILARVFIFLTDPAALPLYTELERLEQEPDAGTKMRQAATTFMGTAEYVGSLASLGPPADRFPVLLTLLRELPGTQSLADLVKLAEEVLGEPLDPYLKSDGFAKVKARTWQSLFAFNLVAPETPLLGNQLVEVLRASRLLERLGVGDKVLELPLGRNEACAALAALPDAVAPGSRELPAPVAARAETLGWTRLLGVGDLKSVKQRLLRYELGEVASIVNVMPFERQQWTERELERSTETERVTASHSEDEELLTVEQDHEELRRELRDVARSGSESRDYNGLKVQYGSSGLDFTVSGTVTGSSSGQRHDDSHAADFARLMSQRVAQRVAETVSRRRARVRLEERERVRQRTFENGTRNEGLIGVYRWVNKVYALSTEGVGRRLVLELLLPQPAARYVATVERQQVAPLSRPAAFEEQVKGPEEITADNYLRLAALYDVPNLQPPPAATRVTVAALQAGASLQMTELMVPEGYTATSAKVAWLLGDAQGTLVGAVGSHTFSTSGPASSQPSQPSSAPSQGTLSLGTLDPHERRIPVAVLSNAPGVFVSVEVTCALDHAQERLIAWQLETYESLRAGYFARLHAWQRLMAEELRKSSTGREAGIVQESLRGEALEVLWARHVPATTLEGEDPRRPAFLRMLDRALSWDQMTYSFFPWGTGTPPERASRHWLGERLLHPESRTLFDGFLTAGSARVLVPVHPGFELLVLFYLAYGQLWPGDVTSTPVLGSTVPLLADLLGLSGTPPREDTPWLIELPTSLLLLGGSTLPASASLLQEAS